MILNTSAQPSTVPKQLPVQPPSPSPVPPQRRWPWRWTLAGILAIGLGAGGFALSRSMQAQANARLLNLTVSARVQDLTERFRVSGRVQPVRQVNISPREAGRLVELRVDQGDVVQAGQILARMDYSNLSGEIVLAQGRIAELQALLAQQRAGERSQTIAAAQARVEATRSRLEQARAEVEQFQGITTAQARLDATRTRLELARSEVDRNQQFWQAGGISRSQFDSKVAARDQAEAELRADQAALENARIQQQSGIAARVQAEADLRAAQQDLALLQAGTRPETIAQTEARIRQAQGQLDQSLARQRETEIRAPFAGIITQRYADIGAFVSPNTAASDATAATSSSILALAQGLEVRADVPEAQIGQVRVGQVVELRPVAFPDQVFRGRVQRIAPATVVVRDVTIFRVTIEPLGSSEALRIGMNLSVDFVGQPRPEALTVPTVALIFQGEEVGTIVWDPAQNRPVYRRVQTGVSQSGITEVTEGLKPDERVFTSLPPGKTLKDFTGQSTTPDW